MKFFVPCHHKNDSKIFVCNQIRDFNAHAREHASEYKNAFSVPHAGLKFVETVHSKDISNQCMAISMLTPTAQRQKLALIFSTRNLLFFRRSKSLGHVVDVTADVNHMLYFVLAT